MKPPTRICFEHVGVESAPAPGPPVDTVRRAVDACDSVAEFLGAAKAAAEPVVLLVNDAYRATMSTAALQALAEFGQSQRCLPRFRALVATGTHTLSPGERRSFEVDVILRGGLPVEDVAWHDADRTERLGRGTTVRVHPWVQAGRFLLPIGSVEPHYFAGMTGAHKTATIGVMSRSDIERNHRGAMAADSRVLRLAGNPVHEGIVGVLLAYGAAGKRVLAINEVVAEGKLLAAAVGDPLESLAKLLPVARAVFTYSVEQPFDVVRLRVPPPLGRSFYQADKALRNNEAAVRDGGCLLLEAACPEGVGQDAFLRLLRLAGDYAGAVRIVEAQGYHLGDHKAVNLRHLTDRARRGVHVALVGSAVSPDDAGILDVHLHPSAESAMEWAADVVPAPLRRGLIVEDAGAVCAAPK